MGHPRAGSRKPAEPRGRRAAHRLQAARGMRAPAVIASFASLLACPLVAADDAPAPPPGPTQPEAIRRTWTVRGIALVSGEGMAFGGGFDVRVARGGAAMHLGGAAAAGTAGGGGFIRAEGSLNYHLGPIYVGAGGGMGTYAIESAMDDKWTGLAVALHGQLGAVIPMGERGVVIEARAGHSLPTSSTIPNDPLPDGVLELTLGIGVKL